MFVPKIAHDVGAGSLLTEVERPIELAPRLRPRLHEAGGSSGPISQLLTHDAIAVPRGMSVETVASFMLQMGLDTLPVIDPAGLLIGVVSTRELLGGAREQRDAVEQAARLSAAEREALADELGDGFHEAGLSGATAGDVMTASTFALSDRASIASAAETMARHGATELPVRCSRCRGFCVVSALDLLVWLARGHREPR